MVNYKNLVGSVRRVQLIQHLTLLATPKCHTGLYKIFEIFDFFNWRIFSRNSGFK